MVIDDAHRLSFWEAIFKFYLQTAVYMSIYYWGFLFYSFFFFSFYGPYFMMFVLHSKIELQWLLFLVLNENKREREKGEGKWFNYYLHCQFQIQIISFWESFRENSFHAALHVVYSLGFGRIPPFLLVDNPNTFPFINQNM